MEEALSYQDFRQYSYFDWLSDESLKKLSTKAMLKEVTSGTRIITQGIPADAFFFIADGEVEVEQELSSGEITRQNVSVSRDSLGKIVLLTCSHRVSSVTAKSHVKLYQLKKRDFGDMVLAESSCSDRIEEKDGGCTLFGKMKSYVPFAQLDKEQFFAIMERLIEKEYAPGEHIVNQGDQGDFYYIIKSGRVAVIKISKEMKEILLAELAEGAAFGEEALIRDLPRNATIRALEKTTVLALSKKDFDKVMAGTFVKNIFPEDIVDIYENNDKIVILDARIPPEFEDEHIKGAINIPIEWLRDQYCNLDQDKVYYTYCANDSRGMVAAFLLNINGFEAQTIRGGLSAWTGSVSFGSSGIYWPKHFDGADRH